MTKEKTIYFGLSHQVRRYVNTNQGDISSLVNLQKDKSFYYSILLTKNSPLMPYFKKVAMESLEFGLTDALLLEWIGPKIKHLPSAGSKTLTAGHTFLIFILLLTFIFLSVLIYVFEVIMAKLWMKSSSTVLFTRKNTIALYQ